MNRRNFFKGILGAIGAAAVAPVAAKGRRAEASDPVKDAVREAIKDVKIDKGVLMESIKSVEIPEWGINHPGYRRDSTFVFITDCTVDGVKIAEYSSLAGWYAQDDSVKPNLIRRGKVV